MNNYLRILSEHVHSYTDPAHVNATLNAVADFKPNDCSALFGGLAQWSRFLNQAIDSPVAPTTDVPLNEMPSTATVQGISVALQQNPPKWA